MKVQVHPIRLSLSEAYLIQFESKTILVDAGMPGEEKKILQVLHHLNGNLKLIFLTHAHYDHYGSAAALRRATGAQIAIHAGDMNAVVQGNSPLGTVRGRGWLGRLLLPLALSILPLEPTPVDLPLEDDQDLYPFGFEARVIHLPGHTPGSAGLWVQERFVFVGDLVTYRIKPRLQRFYASDWSLVPVSLRRLQLRQPECVFPGHGKKPLLTQDLQSLGPASYSEYQAGE